MLLSLEVFAVLKSRPMRKEKHFALSLAAVASTSVFVSSVSPSAFHPVKPLSFQSGEST